jgi:ABC-type transporter MlaC component
VAAYDEQVARTRVQRAATQYIADVEAHRESSRKTSQELRAVARACLAQLAQAANEGTLVLTVSHLNAIVRAFETSIEMEAHALCLDRLLPMLSTEADEAL